MIKSGVAPRCSVVTSGTQRYRKVRSYVIRDASTQRGRAVPVLQVTTGVATIRERDLQRIVVPDVAGRARHISVATSQRETDRRGCVVTAKVCSEPRVKRCVAALTIGGGKVGRIGRVWRIRSVLPILQVAGLAVGGKPIENPCGRLLVAIFAKHCSVHPEQGKTVLVILHLLNRNVPALNGMALLTIRSHLPTVDIGVAIRAMFSDVRED